MQAYDATDNELPIPPQAPIAPLTILPPYPVLSLSPMFDSRHFFPPEKISPSKYAETPVESPIPISQSSSVGSTSPIRVMSSSNYPFIVSFDSDIKDAFSSTSSSNYTPASPDYIPASPRNTSPDSSDNSFGLILIASPTLLLFHDDPYMKALRSTSTASASEAPVMTQAAIRKLVADSVTAALETQAATMANTKNTNRNTRLGGNHVARK
uniref:Uncharacterized protein n=1 Tax=Tanacetum cinerariifolium TaxID=118510 RepID=A0A6L2MYL5_TANCI|nr:hypothetical protein [Tanacetum cinerariifolium]